MTIGEKLKDLPTASGIYIHKNEAGKIIYVGKAKNLRSRVRQYFQSSRNMDPKTRQLVRLITDFEFIVVDNEVEALVLESKTSHRGSGRRSRPAAGDKKSRRRRPPGSVVGGVGLLVDGSPGAAGLPLIQSSFTHHPTPTGGDLQVGA